MSASFRAGTSVLVHCYFVPVVTFHPSRSLTLISMLDYDIIINRQIGGRGSMPLTMS